MNLLTHLKARLWLVVVQEEKLIPREWEREEKEEEELEEEEEEEEAAAAVFTRESITEDLGSALRASGATPT